MKYICYIRFGASVAVEVEANSPEEAAKKAYNSDEGNPTLCHACAHEVELGDAYRCEVFDEDQTALLYDDGVEL